MHVSFSALQISFPPNVMHAFILSSQLGPVKGLWQLHLVVVVEPDRGGTQIPLPLHSVVALHTTVSHRSPVDVMRPKVGHWQAKPLPLFTHVPSLRQGELSHTKNTKNNSANLNTEQIN